MNRQHAEHLLNAYVQIKMSKFDPDASDALREVILDAMTEYRTQTISTYPNVTLPIDNTPKVTWTGYPTIHGTCTTGAVGE